VHPFDRRLPGGPHRSPRQGRAQLVAGGDHAADGGLADGIRSPGRSAISRHGATSTCGRTGFTCRPGWNSMPNARWS
jgi:hypothetical protein